MQLMRSYEGASSEETKLYLVMKERQAPTTRLMVSKDGRRRVDGEWSKIPEEEEERDVTDGGRQEGQAERLAQDTVIVEIVAPPSSRRKNCPRQLWHPSQKASPSQIPEP